MEKFLLKNMWKIIFSLWIIIFLTWLIPLINLPTWQIIEKVFWINQVKQIISTQYMLTTIWAIFAFWYWYKRYERDKEIEMIDKLILKENIDELIIDWKAKRIFYEKWYIKDYLWNIIESNYQIKFDEYIWILKDINYEDDLIIDMRLVISKLITYEWAKDYFIKQVKLIEKVLEWQASFYKKLNENEYKSKIIYYEQLRTEVWKILNWPICK